MVHAPPLAAGLATGLAAAALALTACSTAPEQGAGSDLRFVSAGNKRQDVAVANRHPAPPLAGQTLSGGRLDLTALHGQVVVVNFWGSWCAPCRAEAAGLQQTYAANRGRGVTFLGVDERDGLAAARSFTRDKGVTYPSLFDQDGTLVSLWPAGSAVPFTFLIDRQGRIASRFTGGVLPTDLQPGLNRLVAER